MRVPVWIGEGEGTEMLNDKKESYLKARSGAVTEKAKIFKGISPQ